MFKIVLFFIMILTGSCTLAPNEEILYMKSKNSYHPIYVRGNVNADAYLIWVHGGPGSSGMYYGNMKEVAQLHEKYRVIYWDQLSSGGTSGNPDPSEFTIKEFASHVQGIVNIVQNRYKPRKMFIIGHSWGGLLSSYYLMGDGNLELARQRQSQLDGYIALNAVWDMPDAITNGIDYITNYANNEIAKGNDVKKWQKRIKWYQDLGGNLEGEAVADHFENICEIGGMVMDRDRLQEIIKEQTIEMAFLSPFEFFSYFVNQTGVRTYLRVEKCSLVQPTKPNVSMIDIPTIVLAGRKDKVAFDDDSIRWHQVLTNGKTNVEDYPLAMFENSAHSIFLDEPQRFIDEVDNFIKTHSR